MPVELHSSNSSQTLSRAERRRALREARAHRQEDPRHLLQENGLSALGLQLALTALEQMMEEDVDEVCGVGGKWEQNPDCRVGYRNGREVGQVCVGGRKVPILRPRAIRRKDLGGGELPLPSYQAAQDPEWLTNAVLTSTVLGVSQRNYKPVLSALAPAGDQASHGCSKSAVNRRFIRASKRFLKKFLARRLDKRYLAVWVDALGEGDYSVVAAVGLTDTGDKEVLGLRQGSTENAELCREFLEELGERGLSVEQGLLFIVDGGKGVAKALRELFGSRVAVQRCRVHKKRNVLDKLTLPEAERELVERSLEEAWKTADAVVARAKMELLARGLEKRGQKAAAASLREGMREMLTCCRVGVPVELFASLTNTNVIESAFSQYEATAHRVKRWHHGRQLLRWVTMALYRAECSFTRLGRPDLIRRLAAALERFTAKGASRSCRELPLAS